MRYAIGDIHGCLETFLQLLKEIEFTKDDTLYILGDMVDRGPKSAQVVDTIIKMIDNGYDVNVILGNHEDLMIKAIEDKKVEYIWARNGAWKTLESYGAKFEGYGSAPWYEVISMKHWNFLKSLPRKIVLDDYILVHAGLNTYLTDPINKTDDYDLTWIRDVDFNYDKNLLGGRTIISGHTITSKQEIIQLNEEFKSQIIIDNGCFLAKNNTYGPNYGSLCSFCLDSRTLHFTPCIDFN